jgi:hypothetical protein
MTGKDVEGDGVNLKYYSRGFLEGDKARVVLDEDMQCPGRDWNRVPPESKTPGEVRVLCPWVRMATDRPFHSPHFLLR